MRKSIISWGTKLNISWVLVTEQTGEGGLNDIKDPPFFLQGFLPCTRFTLPAARGKMSLNARDW